jgi:prepilin-type N-terminal cleavage/methylation domain-containing protein
MIREKRGFSLIEVLIGIIFLAIGLLAVAGMQATSVRGNFFSNNVMLATYVAQDRLEYLRSIPMESPELTVRVHNDGAAPQPLTSSFKHLDFNRSYTVNEVIDGTHGNYKSIKYTVTWSDPVNHSLEFYTMRSQ